MASTIEIKTASNQEYIVCLKMRGEGNMPLNNVNVGNRYCRFVNCHCFRYSKILEKKACLICLPINMPKPKPSILCHLKAVVSEFGDIFSADSKILLCKMCKTIVVSDRKFTVQQHVGHEKHIRAMQLASKKSTQLLLQETASMKDNKLSDFQKNFCEALVSANVLFLTLNNAKLKHFHKSSMLQL